MPSIGECIIALALLTGTFFTVVACIGLLRFPDVYCRMHAAGKAATLGVSLVLVAVGIFFAVEQPGIAVRAVLAIFFQFLTTPAATHLLARACYLSEYPLAECTSINELRQFMDGRLSDDFGQE
mgnify:CR=1 FL=1